MLDTDTVGGGGAQHPSGEKMNVGLDLGVCGLLPHPQGQGGRSLDVLDGLEMTDIWSWAKLKKTSLPTCFSVCDK